MNLLKDKGISGAEIGISAVLARQTWKASVLQKEALIEGPDISKQQEEKRGQHRDLST